MRPAEVAAILELTKWGRLPFNQDALLMSQYLSYIFFLYNIDVYCITYLN